MRTWLLALTVGVTACGGKVVIDLGSGGAGGSPTGTSSSTGDGTSSAVSGAGGSCVPAACPMFPPNAGSPCACSGQACPYDSCPQDGALSTATCTNGVWSLQTSPCAAAPCGTTSCAPGQVCLHHMSGVGIFQSCIPDPCGGSPLACSCATSVCPVGNANTCAVMGGELFCGCGLCN